MGIGRDLDRIVEGLASEKMKRELGYAFRDAGAKAAITDRESHRYPRPCRICGHPTQPRSPYCAEHDWTR